MCVSGFSNRNRVGFLFFFCSYQKMLTKWRLVPSRYLVEKIDDQGASGARLYEEALGAFWEEALFWLRPVPEGPSRLVVRSRSRRPRIFNQINSDLTQVRTKCNDISYACLHSLLRQNYHTCNELGACSLSILLQLLFRLFCLPSLPFSRNRKS